MGNFVSVIYGENKKPSLESIIESLLKNYPPDFLKDIDLYFNRERINIDEIRVIA